jgi:hypothetical protein
MSKLPLKPALVGLALVGLFLVACLAVYYFAAQASKETTPASEGPSRGPGFKDIAAEAGITFRMAFLPKEQGENFKANLYDHGCGIAIADFDGDGFDDIYLLNQLGANALYRNKGDGTFEDVTARAGVGLGDRICVGATFADYDNDGRPDLYVTSTRGGNVLFRNLGNGKFQDVSKDAGVGWIGHSQTAVFFDFDNDGYLDLFLTNSAKWTTNEFDREAKNFAGVKDLFDLFKCVKEYNVLFRNNRDGTFTNVTDQAGLKGPGWGGDVVVFDFDEDGYQDLLVTNMFGPCRLYRNNGNGTFADVSRKVLPATSFGSIGTKAFDFNNDGKLDLFLVDMHSDMWLTPGHFDKNPQILAYLKKNEKERYQHISGPPRFFDATDFNDKEKLFGDLLQVQYEQVIFGNTLFKNLGSGRFEEVAEKAGMETWWPWGVATGDFDNDGFEDVFIPSGMGYPFPYWPNRLMMNNGNETFTEQSAQEGIEPPRAGIYLGLTMKGRKAPRSSRCAAVADFRNNGRLDLVVNNFNDHPYYFQNQFPQQNHLAFRLQGTKSNRDAVGALVRLYIGKEVMVRQVQGAGGYLSQSSQTLHFGLGQRGTIDRVEIVWPSGKRQTLPAPAINRMHKIVEPPA